MKRIDEKIENFIKVCQDVLKDKLLSIILFGSASRGKQRVWSDLDFCVVVKDYLKDEFEKKVEIMKRLGYSVDILFRKKGDIKGYLKMLSPVDLNIFQDGVIIEGEDILVQYRPFFNKIVKEKKLVSRKDLGNGVWEIGVEREKMYSKAI